MVAATPPRLAVALLALWLLIGWSQQAALHHHPRLLSPPLDDEQTSTAVREVSEQAEQQDNSSVRLIPNVPDTQDHWEICCIHVNILDFYLNGVLPPSSADNTHVHRLHVDLRRISHDLKKHGCNITNDHQHAAEFRRRYFALDGGHRQVKALSEMNILFFYLQDFCVKPGVAAATS